jgi:hypothetical protein
MNAVMNPHIPLKQIISYKNLTQCFAPNSSLAMATLKVTLCFIEHHAKKALGKNPAMTMHFQLWH